LVHGALILGYHRVADAPWDPYGLCVTPRHFAEQLEVLRKHAHLISLRQLASTLWDGTLPRRAVILTFDDGYADNLYQAKPLLEHYQIPATVFVTTGYMGREFWWDELARFLLPSQTLPARLRLPVAGVTYEWELGDAASRVPVEDAVAPRQRLLLSLYRLLRPLGQEERQKAMDQLRDWAGSDSKSDPLHPALAADEVVQLARGGLLQVGAHTVTHPVLATLAPASQRSEIQGSKTCLEGLLGQEVTTFSYPNGSAPDCSVGIVRESGFTCACGSSTDIAWYGSDRFQLPRFWAQDWDGVTLSRWLGKWLGT
jgi:peptidoglycan/xylan/chitin deacetylase (PgdA/CDA1 family)